MGAAGRSGLISGGQAPSRTWAGRRDVRWPQSSSPARSRPVCWQSWMAWCSRSEAALAAGWGTWVGAGSSKGLAWNSRDSRGSNRVSQPAGLTTQAGPPLPLPSAPLHSPPAHLLWSSTQARPACWHGKASGGLSPGGRAESESL